MNTARGKKKGREALLEDIRLVVEASPFDEELEVKVEAVENELQAIDQALADEGTYLGIVDKVELEKRKVLLEKRQTLLKQERDLLHALHVALREENALAAAEPLEWTVSSPEPHEGNQTAVETAEQSSPSSVETPANFPSSQSTAPPNLYSFSLPLAADNGIDDFLKKNAAVGILAGGASGSSNNVASAQLLGRDTRGRGNRRHYDSDVDEDLA